MKLTIDTENEEIKITCDGLNTSALCRALDSLLTEGAKQIDMEPEKLKAYFLLELATNMGLPIGDNEDD